ncbi:MAG: molybdopterin-dependent oxidoreductase [Burkholderiaceae bacterium]
MTIAPFRRALLIGALAYAALVPPAQATLAQPEGPVILSITGKVEVRNQGDQAAFDLEMIEKLPQRSFTTQTPWDKKPTKFTGPLLRDVLAAAKARGQTITAMALNDYKITIPMDDAIRFDVLLAHRINDEPIPVRTKGPLFIIYPFDAKPELKTARYYERSVWQLRSLTID